MRVNENVLTVLDGAQTDGNQLVLVGQLDHKLYEQTNKVLEAAGGKWNRKAKAHLFEGGAAEAIEQIILSGEITTHQDFDFFPTPVPIVNRLMELAEIGPGMDVLEPSAGIGNIVRALPALSNVDAVELRPYYASSIPRRPGVDVRVVDFLTLAPEPDYDRVVMNPPFSKQQDIKHVLHALEFLKPGGRLVSVMSAGVTFRQNRLTIEFRKLVADHEGTIEPNADDAFRDSGTMVRTVNVVIPN